ncbi:ferric iron uptake transcriptional regulator [Aquabacterium sp.]|uniref:ferric iron uptake transcriptional regulator n=1 Tax=Aquabacterium sp. TaxID=1872578 RepID=UPI004037EEBE
MDRKPSPTSSQLQSTGLKATTPRVKILQILRNASTRHMSVEDIYRQLRQEGAEIGLATVYRVLGQFELAGLLVRHHFEGGKAVYELNEGDHHDHLVCMACGQVEEFYDNEIERLQQQIAQSRGYRLKDHTLAMYGLCARCATCPP